MKGIWEKFEGERESGSNIHRMLTCKILEYFLLNKSVENDQG